MSTNIQNRTELLFLYEIENANPNGDPLNENRPRFDTEDGTVVVSDVRLKRTIRDYLFAYKGHNGTDGRDIFVRETKYEEGDKSFVADGKRRAKDFGESKEKVLSTCIDLRLFGGVIPLNKDSITLTGPTQFQMGRSLHQVEIITEQGTGAFASGSNKAQATFRTEYKIPYGIIGFNGIINEKAGKYSGMTDQDKAELFEGIWEGTKHLISRSKFGQTPLLLLVINYKDSYYTGNLRQRIKLESEKNDLAIRSTADYCLNMTELWKELKNNADKIESVEVKFDARLDFTGKEKIRDGKMSLNEI
jgi:CRISPR-associated protein Csh2